MLDHICWADGNSHYREDAAMLTLPLATACSVSPEEGCRSVWSTRWPVGTQTSCRPKSLWYTHIVIFPQHTLCPTGKWQQWLRRGQLCIIPARWIFLFSPQPMPIVEPREGDLLIFHDLLPWQPSSLQRPGGATTWANFSLVHSSSRWGMMPKLCTAERNARHAGVTPDALKPC